MTDRGDRPPIRLIKQGDDFYLSIWSDGEEGLIHLEEAIWIKWAKESWLKSPMKRGGL